MRLSASSPRATIRASNSLFSSARAVRLLGLLGHLTDDRQHRPFDGTAHGAVGGVARGAERTRHERRVDLVVLAQHLGEPPHDLAEDDPGVAARAHQRSTGELLRNGFVAGGARAVERLDDRADGEREIGAGIAVRHRVDVEVVDALPVRLEVAQRGRGDLSCALEVHEERLTSSMRTSTAATVSPVCARPRTRRGCGSSRRPRPG